MRNWNFRLLIAAATVTAASTVQAGFPIGMGQPAASGPQMMPAGPRQIASYPQQMSHAANVQQAAPQQFIPNGGVFVRSTPLPTGPAHLANPYVYSQRGNPQRMNPQIATSQASQHLAQAIRFESQNNVRMAIQAYHRALECDAANRLALISFARMKHRIGDLDGAIVTYRQSLKYHPNDPVALNDLGLCHARRGESADALQCLTTASRLDPQNGRYANNLAIVLVEAGRIDEALATLEQSIGPAFARYNLAMLLKDRGAVAQAGQHLEQALALDPSFSPAKELLTDLRTNPAGNEGIANVDQPASMAAMDKGNGGDFVATKAMGEVAPEPTMGPAVQATSLGEGEQPVEPARWNFLNQ